jgi:hypothetical protein
MLRCTADHTFCLETQARQIPESARTHGPTLQVGLYLALSHPASNSATCSAKWPLPNPAPVELSRLKLFDLPGHTTEEQACQLGRPKACHFEMAQYADHIESHGELEIGSELRVLFGAVTCMSDSFRGHA